MLRLQQFTGFLERGQDVVGPHLCNLQDFEVGWYQSNLAFGIIQLRFFQAFSRIQITGAANGAGVFLELKHF